jgi:pyridoxal phosphate enzyme (YggS family)
MNLAQLRTNWISVNDRIAAAAERAGRTVEGIRLVAVTKRSRPEAVRALVECGARELGENYPQELWRKAEALADLPVRWHLIGHLQSNKAKRTLPLVKMIHSVDSLKLLRSLNDLATGLAEPPTVCLQVNASEEETKHGWSPESLLADADSISACRTIPIVGLMTMAALGRSPEEARPAFARLRETRDALKTRTGLALRELSMGMTHDFEVAIEEGATWLRIGSALFEGVEE